MRSSKHGPQDIKNRKEPKENARKKQDSKEIFDDNWKNEQNLLNEQNEEHQQTLFNESSDEDEHSDGSSEQEQRLLNDIEEFEDEQKSDCYEKCKKQWKKSTLCKTIVYAAVTALGCAGFIGYKTYHNLDRNVKSTAAARSSFFRLEPIEEHIRQSKLGYHDPEKWNKYLLGRSIAQTLLDTKSVTWPAERRYGGDERISARDVPTHHDHDVKQGMAHVIEEYIHDCVHQGFEKKDGRKEGMLCRGYASTNWRRTYIHGGHYNMWHGPNSWDETWYNKEVVHYTVRIVDFEGIGKVVDVYNLAQCWKDSSREEFICVGKGEKNHHRRWQNCGHERKWVTEGGWKYYLLDCK